MTRRISETHFRFLRRLFRNQTVFIIVNTAFWLGLLALLWTDPWRMAVGAGVLALALGGLIRSQERALRLPRRLENLPRCYALLLQRVAPAVRAAGLGNTAPTSAATVPAAAPVAGGPVYAFAVSRRVWALNLGALALLVLIYLGLGLLGIWIGLARGEIPPFNTVWVRNALIFFAMISVFFVPALIISIRSLWTRYGPYRMERPVAWEFYGDRIRYRFPRGGGRSTRRTRCKA